jgi:uncharacterized protein DUF5134
VWGPAWLTGAFTAVMLGVAAYSAVRLLSARHLRRRLHYDVDVAHVTMGVAMAGMLVPTLDPLPNTAWDAAFGVIALWFLWKSLRAGTRHLADRALQQVSHHLAHLVMACAMIYMYLALAPDHGVARSAVPMAMAMGGATGSTAFAGLPLVFVVFLLASAVWHVDRLGPFVAGTSATGPAAPLPDPLGGAGAVATLPPTLPPTGAPGGPAGGRGGGPATRTIAAGVPLTGVARGSRGGEGERDGERAWLAPRSQMACHVAMCVVMCYMLVLML